MGPPDLPTLAAGLGMGGAVGAMVAYFILRASPRGRALTVAKVVEAKTKSASAKVVPRYELDRMKREAKTLILEKELLSSALTRVYEAEVEKKISREEREMLSAKYRDQLKAVDSKLATHEAFIEVGELESLRDELLKLFEEKITHIERRLDRARAELGEIHLTAQAPTPQAPATQPKEKAEKVEEKPGSEVDRRVKELRNEVLEALARLEQMDIEG